MRHALLLVPALLLLAAVSWSQSAQVQVTARSADHARRQRSPRRFALRTHMYSTPSTMSMPQAFLPAGPLPTSSPVGEGMFSPRTSGGQPWTFATPMLSLRGAGGGKPQPSP